MVFITIFHQSEDVFKLVSKSPKYHGKSQEILTGNLSFVTDFLARKGRHVVFGTILEGMKFVRQIEAQNGTPPKEAGS